MAYNMYPLVTVTPFTNEYQTLGYIPDAKPPPTRDHNFTDPIKENIDYIKKIQKIRIHNGFEGLRNEMFFLMEVLIESIELKEEVAETIDYNIKEEELFKSSVKFFNFPFWEIDETLVDEGNDINKFGSSYSDLFNAIFRTTGLTRMTVQSKISMEGKDIEDNKHENKSEEEKVTIITEKENSEIVSNAKKSERKEHKKSKRIRKSKESRGSKEVEKVEDSKETFKEEKVKAIFTINKGKSTLVVMTGLKMISNLQEHSVIVQMRCCDVMEEETKVERILGESSLRLPERFRLFVLSAVTSNANLPCVEQCTTSHKLLDINKQEVGTILITVSLTCFGSAIENCIRETKVNDAYEHTYCWRTFISKLKDTGKDAKEPKVEAKLALHMLKTNSKIKPKKCDSTELLRHCIGWSMIAVDNDEQRRALKRKDCDWFKMVKNVNLKTYSSFDSSKLSETDELDLLFKRQERFCRDLQEKETKRSKGKMSLFERLEDVKMQSGLVLIETQNPFMSSAQISTNVITLAENDKSFDQPNPTSSKQSLVNL